MNEYELIYNYFCQDERALLELYQSLEHAVKAVWSKYKHLIRYSTFGREDYFAEAQQLLVSALEKYRMDLDVPFEQFYTGILCSRMIDISRSAGRKNPVFYETCSLDQTVRDSKIFYRDLITDGKDPHTIVMQRSFLEIIERVCQKNLSELEYEIFQERLAGSSIREIACSQHVTVKKVRVTMDKVKSYANFIDPDFMQ